MNECRYPALGVDAPARTVMLAAFGIFGVGAVPRMIVDTGAELIALWPFWTPTVDVQRVEAVNRAIASQIGHGAEPGQTTDTLPHPGTGGARLLSESGSTAHTIAHVEQLFGVPCVRPGATWSANETLNRNVPAEIASGDVPRYWAQRDTAERRAMRDRFRRLPERCRTSLDGDGSAQMALPEALATVVGAMIADGWTDGDIWNLFTGSGTKLYDAYAAAIGSENEQAIHIITEAAILGERGVLTCPASTAATLEDAQGGSTDAYLQPLMPGVPTDSFLFRYVRDRSQRTDAPIEAHILSCECDRR